MFRQNAVRCPAADARLRIAAELFLVLLIATVVVGPGDGYVPLGSTAVGVAP
jgi:hypothetical protein